MSTPVAVPWRLGATSYVVEAGLVENARYLAGRVTEMQLVLFDLPGGPGNLPTQAEVAALAEIGRTTGLGYTLHLLADIGAPGLDEGAHAALAWAHLLLARTRPLRPSAVVLHLDGRAVRSGRVTYERWSAALMPVLRQVGVWAGGMAYLALENLEGYPAGFVVEAAAHSGARRCVDVGHLWRDGVDPLPWLAQAGDALSVVHLHGVRDDVREDGAPRTDHVALDAAPAACLDAVIAHLLARRYAGVLTLEVFGQADFDASLAALRASVARVQAARVAGTRGSGDVWASN